MAVFPTLDFVQIKARYPKAVKKITEWIFSQPELKENMEGYIDQKDPEASKEMFVGLLIQMDPRKLYDIFDSFNIFSTITYSQMQKQWIGEVLTEGYTHSCLGNNRHDVEQSAFHDAFEILEKSL